MAPATRTLVLGFATGLLTALLWGSWAVLSRLGLTGALDFLDVAALRFAVAGLVLLPVVLRQRVGAKGVGPVPWRAVGLMWLGAGVPYALLVFAGLQAAPAGHQAVIGPSGVMLFTAALSVWVLGERYSARQLAGMGVIVAGVAVVGWQGLTGGAQIGFGHALFVVAAVLWSVFTVAARKWRVDAVLATALVAVVSLFTYVPAYFVMTGTRLFHLPPGQLVFQGLYQGLLTGVVALVLYMRTVAALGAGRAALFTAFVPAMAAALAVPILGEPLTWPVVVGAAAVTFGMALAIGAGAFGPGRAAATAGQSAGVLPGSKP